jgi:hypothetical protein
MENIKIKQSGLRTAVAVAVIPLLFISCLKDKGPGTENYSNSPALISFQYGGFSAQPFTVAMLGTPTDSIALEVTLSVASITLGTPVTATISPDQASLDDYNTANGTAYQMLPSDMYTIQNNGAVTISPGQQIVSLSVHFAGDKVDFSKDNGLALKITAATGATIATNLNTAILLLKLKSIYEGSYSETGTLTRFNGGTEASGVLDQFDISGSTYFSTIDLTTIEGQIVIPGFVATYARYTVNPDNTVTISQSPVTPYTNMGNTPGKTSTYDPATKTFDLHGGFLNSAGNLREFDYTMTLE